MNKLLSLLMIVPALAFGIEEPDYTLVGTYDDVEYRQYADYIVVETLVEGEYDRNEASNIGFRRLFKYITGENSGSEEIAMTAPVQVAQKGVEIAMTAPVQSVNTDRGWTISFIVPKKYTWETVPKPTNSLVYLRNVPGELQAVKIFSGRWTEENTSKAREELYKKLSDVNVNTIGESITAAYNSPFSIPWFRRNEIIVTIDKIPTEYITN